MQQRVLPERKAQDLSCRSGDDIPHRRKGIRVQFSSLSHSGGAAAAAEPPMLQAQDRAIRLTAADGAGRQLRRIAGQTHQPQLEGRLDML